MTKTIVETPEPEEFEDDPQLRKLFKSYLRETLDEFFAEQDNEEGNDDDGTRRTGEGTSGPTESDASRARADTSESKVKRISKSIFTRN